MAVILDIDFPEGCSSCPLNDDEWACVVTGKPIAEYGAPMDCPLYDIPEHGKEILKAVMDERTKGLTVSEIYTAPGSGPSGSGPNPTEINRADGAAARKEVKDDF